MCSRSCEWWCASSRALGKWNPGTAKREKSHRKNLFHNIWFLFYLRRNAKEARHLGSVCMRESRGNEFTLIPRRSLAQISCQEVKLLSKITITFYEHSNWIEPHPIRRANKIYYYFILKITVHRMPACFWFTVKTRRIDVRCSCNFVQTILISEDEEVI